MYSQTDDDSNEIARDEYDRLPEAIKAVYSFEGWLWLSGGQKRDLERDETEPEVG